MEIRNNKVVDKEYLEDIFYFYNKEFVQKKQNYFELGENNKLLALRQNEDAEDLTKVEISLDVSGEDKKAIILLVMGKVILD